jgi:hypothetical protein
VLSIRAKYAAADSSYYSFKQRRWERHLILELILSLPRWGAHLDCKFVPYPHISIPRFTKEKKEFFPYPNNFLFLSPSQK